MIYVARTHRVNATNILVALLIESAGARVHGACYYAISTDGFLDQVPGDFARSMVSDPLLETRHVDWTQRWPELEHYHLRAGKDLIFGSHHPDQIEFLKQQFGESVCGIALNYDTDDYDHLIVNMARDHVRLLDSNRLTSSAHDLDLARSLSVAQRIEHYAQEFDRMGLIPTSVQETYDYQVEYRDLLRPARMAQVVEQLGFEFTARAKLYYDHWLARQIV